MSAGLFFRRRYSVGDDVDVVLCKGLDSQRGRIAVVRENDTYDVNLELDGNPSKNQSEIGVQIPPEYLRPHVIGHETARCSASKQDALKATIEELYLERQSLREELETLTQAKETLESQPAQPVQTNGQGEPCDASDFSKSSEKAAVKTVHDTAISRRDPHADSFVATQAQRSNPALGTTKNLPQARCWLGSLSCGGQPFSPSIASTVLPLSAGTDGELVDSEADAQLDRYDVIGIALQDCTTPSKDVARIVRSTLGPDDNRMDEDWCVVDVESRLVSSASGAKATTMAVFSRREILLDDEHSLKAATAPSETGLSTVAVYVKLRYGARLALLSANTNFLQHNEQESILLRNAHVRAHFVGEALEEDDEGFMDQSPFDVSRQCEHAIFIGDLGYSYDVAGDDDKRNGLMELIAVSDWSALSSADALRQEKAAHHVFCGEYCLLFNSCF